jgi:DNA repair protein RecO (recombination protein O)
MRHKYETRGIVLSRTSLGEANALVTILTPEIGLIRARAQGVRRSGAKLSAALTTFAESDFVLVRGKEGWRIAGGVLMENWFLKMRELLSRQRVGRVTGLFLRFVAGEEHDPKLFLILEGFLRVLTELPESEHDAAEILAVLRVLTALGLDTGGLPEETELFSSYTLDLITQNRSKYIARINNGISASGL